METIKAIFEYKKNEKWAGGFVGRSITDVMMIRVWINVTRKQYAPEFKI